MKPQAKALLILASTALFSSCAVNTTTDFYTPPYAEYSNYQGYTVVYGYDNGDDAFGHLGSYRGYGGWDSSYYAPGYRHY